MYTHVTFFNLQIRRSEMPDLTLERVQGEVRVRVQRHRRRQALALAHPPHAPDAAAPPSSPEPALGRGRGRGRGRGGMPVAAPVLLSRELVGPPDVLGTG